MDELVEEVGADAAKYFFLRRSLDSHLDFDIEGDEIHHPETLERRAQAIAQLQADAAAQGRDLVVSFTLPVLPTGLTDAGIGVLESAIEHGVRIDVVNIMTMNFGEGFPSDQMGQNTIDAAQSLFEQLRVLYPEKEETELWPMIGLTPMIGINDRQAEVFRLQDAELVTAFAQEQGIRLLAMWNLDRDQPCEYTNSLSPRCSGTDQTPYGFSEIMNQVTRGNGNN